MIIDFTIKNYRSYKNETTLTFEALDESYKNDNYVECAINDGTPIKLLKSMAIFGANAAGKSNMIKALGALSGIVRKSLSFDVNRRMPYYLPFLLDNESSNLPSCFSLRFIVNDRAYLYEIQINSYVHKETLSLLANEKSLPIYKRWGNDENDINYNFYGEWESLKAKVDNDGVLPNQLILSRIGRMDAMGLQYVYAFIANIHVDSVENVNSRNNEKVAGKLIEDEGQDLFDSLQRLIKVADFGIIDIEKVEHKISEFNLPDNVPSQIRNQIYEENRWEFRMLHKGSKLLPFPSALESTGTNAILGVGPTVLKVLKNGGILACDEMNFAIHPKLFSLIVSLFHSPVTNPKHAQLLMTTHDMFVCEELRADQVWFAAKNEFGISELYSAQDFEDASIAMPFEAWYRAGRFGALPKFGNINYIATGDEQ